MSKFHPSTIILAHCAAQPAPKLRQQQPLGETGPQLNLNPPFARATRLILAHVAVFLALQSATTAQVVNQSYTTGQLVINPGAETTNNVGGFLYPTGWTNTGAVNFIADNGSYDSGLTPHVGSYQFVCAQTAGASGHISQNIDVTSFLSGASISGLTSGNTQASSIATIASGTVTANIGFWQRSFNQGGYGDYNAITLKFLDASGNAIGTYSTPYQDNITGWTYCSFSTPVPVGTCTITYQIDSYLNPINGAWMDAFVDDNSFTLSTASVTVSNQTVANNQLNLLVNGNFETGGSSTPPGWTSPDGYFHPVGYNSYLAGNGVAANGSWCLQMGDPNEGKISQTFATIPGATYTLSFNYAGNWGAGDAAQLFYVQLNGADISIPMVGTAGAYLTSAVANAPYRLIGQQVSTKTKESDIVPNQYLETVPGLVASGTTTTLTFGAQRWYEYLDNVTMVLAALPSQNISFNAPLSQQYSTSPVSLRANASSGLPVTFSIMSGPATVSGSNVTMTGIGHVVVRASQPGSASWAPAANVDMAFDISQGSQTINFGALSNVTYGTAPITLSATSDSGLPVSFSYVSGPATVIGSTLTITGTGTVMVKASQPGNTLYAAATPVTQSFTVSPEAQSISFGTLADRNYTTTTFTVSASSTSGLPVAFSIASGPATIIGNSITINGVGTVMVQATQVGNTLYAPATPVNQSFTVNPAPQTIYFALASTQTYSTTPITLAATSDSGLAVAYSVTAGNSFAHVVGSTLYLDGAGQVTIQATQTGNTNYLAATPVSRSVNVQQASQTISFALANTQTYSTMPITLTGTSTSGLAVTYAVTSGNAYAHVSGSSLYLDGAGQVTVQATQTGNTNYLAANPVSQTFTVQQAAQTISFALANTLTYSTDPISLTGTSTSGLAVAYSVTAGGTFAHLVGSSLYLDGAGGSVTIHATQGGNTNYLAATPVDRTFSINKADQTIIFNAIPGQVFSFSPIALIASSDSNLQVSFSVVTGNATVSSTNLTLTGTGDIKVRASQVGDSNYNAAADIDRTFTVTANIDSWRNSNFTAAELADPTKSSDTAIYGHDGLPNLVKYALGLNPKTDTTTVPAISSDGTYWVYTYSLATGLTDISVAAESTTDLTNWSGSGVTITLLNSANGFDNYKATRPISSAANAFFRLHVTH